MSVTETDIVKCFVTLCINKHVIHNVIVRMGNAVSGFQVGCVLSSFWECAEEIKQNLAHGVVGNILALFQNGY